MTKSSLCECECGGRHSLDAFWAVVGWSLRSLAAGVWPSRDHLGRDWADEYRSSRAGAPLRLRGACLQFRGDWPWLSGVFGLSYHSNTAACFLCHGRMDLSVPLTDVSTDAKWRSQLVSGPEWLASRAREGNYITGVFSWPGFAWTSIVLDFMHVVDLGIAQECLGNILWEVFQLLGGTVSQAEATLARMLVLLRDVANDLEVPCPLSKITLGMIRQRGKPRLRAKAAKTRYLVPLVLRLLVSHFPARSDRDLRRQKCLEYLNAAYCELNEWGEGSAARLEVALRRHVLLYLSLARDVLAEDCHAWLRWRFKPKHHMVMHLAGEQARRMGSPKTWWCYSDESSIGYAVGIAESVHPLTLPRAAMIKNLVVVMLEMRET